MYPPCLSSRGGLYAIAMATALNDKPQPVARRGLARIEYVRVVEITDCCRNPTGRASVELRFAPTGRLGDQQPQRAAMYVEQCRQLFPEHSRACRLRTRDRTTEASGSAARGLVL